MRRERTCPDYRHHVDYRCVGEPQWSLGRPADADVRIPDDLLTCPVFLGGQDTEKRLHYRATAFLISTPTKTSENGARYLVTARHNVLKAQREYGNVYIRINTPDGAAIDHPIKGAWEYPDDDAVDIAAIPFAPPFKYAASPIPARWFLSDEVVDQRKVGIGEELVIVGLFSKHVGASRNLPIVRSGNIASMPQELLIDDASGDEFRAYLAEVRSIGGLSGSPVFVALNPFVRMHEEVGVFDGGGPDDEPDIEAFYLLGLVRGHWNTSMESDFGESESDRLNTGIAMVTPITEILPLLEKEAFVKHRKDIDRDHAAKSGMVEDWGDEVVEGEHDRFALLTRKLLQVPKKELDDKLKEDG
jgi:hypothetical protein